LEEKNMSKKFLALALSLVLALSLTACGGSTGSTDTDSSAADTTDTADTADTTAEPVTLTVAATSVPHAEILEAAKPLLAEKGIDLVIQEYSDYVVPNTAVDEGDADANYFQHLPYLEQFNEEYGTDIVSVAQIHYEPMGIYGGKVSSLDELADGATVAVPNDVTNEARALQLLAAQGLIEIDPDAGLNATPNDITSNPKNLQFAELAAEMLPNTVEEYDLNVINSNYAMQAGLNPAEDALASEDADSEAAQTFANIIAVKAGNENDERIQALVEVLTSDTIRDFINENYQGSVLPIF
jgi:D-methionine transport system substrate-binding protein